MSETRRVRGATRVCGVIGWPVEHSLSPAIHNAAFQSLGLDWVYVPMPVPPGRLDEALAGLRALGVAGANVTMPHKREAARGCSTLSEDARLTDAVNTLVVDRDGLSGHNTDVAGFTQFLARDVGFDVPGRRALLLGAGGAGHAVLLALRRGGIDRVWIAARSPDRVRLLQEAEWAPPIELVPWEDMASAQADLVVNASPVRWTGATAPSPPLGPGTTVVDLVYRPADTGLVRLARERGADAFGGLGMLLRQGAISFEIWTGQPAPLDVMSAAALAELADDAR